MAEIGFDHLVHQAAVALGDGRGRDAQVEGHLLGLVARHEDAVEDALGIAVLGELRANDFVDHIAHALLVVVGGDGIPGSLATDAHGEVQAIDVELVGLLLETVEDNVAEAAYHPVAQARLWRAVGERSPVVHLQREVVFVGQRVEVHAGNPRHLVLLIIDMVGHLAGVVEEVACDALVVLHEPFEQGRIVEVVGGGGSHKVEGEDVETDLYRLGAAAFGVNRFLSASYLGRR